jgi:hypothetical protein
MGKIINSTFVSSADHSGRRGAALGLTCSGVARGLMSPGPDEARRDTHPLARRWEDMVQAAMRRGMRSQVELIAYADRFGGDLAGLRALLGGPLQGLFGGVHVLPFYRPFDGADAGFDPQDHTE